MSSLNFADILTSTANRLPGHLALITDKGSLTYQELDWHANSLARGLLDLDVKQGSIIACLLPNGPEIVTTYFAAARIRACLVPVNYHLKPREIQCLLEHSEARLLIAHICFSEVIESLDRSLLEKVNVIWAGKDSPKNNTDYEVIIDTYPRLDINLETNPNELCNILYTSGTTGDPKGVMRTHENNFWAAVNMAVHIPHGPEDIELFLLPMFSIGFFNIYAPNIVGGSTVIVKEGFEPEETLRTIEEHGITRLYLVPYMWNKLISHPRFHEYNVSCLKQILAGSAPMPIATKLHLLTAFPMSEIYEVWGMTEGGLISLRPCDAGRKLGSIGKPVPFNEAKIVDEQGFELAPGTVGEIVIRGKTVTPGYYKNPDLTKISFNDEGWFRTGDLARYDEEGYFYIAGRRSDMIIFGDNKVYPQEVEEVLLRHPSVKEAAVFGVPDQTWGETVVAVVVTHNPVSITQEELLEFVDSYLASYKKPKYIFFADSLPKTASGKIIKSQLRDKYSFTLFRAGQ